MPQPTPIRITLIISRAAIPDDWQQVIDHRIASPWLADLFFLHQGMALLADHRWDKVITPANPGSYCALSHQRGDGPTPAPGMQPAGLATLGRLIRDNPFTLTLSDLHWPDQPAHTDCKRIAIRLPASTAPTATADQREAWRLATGLAGCDHQVTLFHDPDQQLSIDDTIQPYHQALLALQARIAPLTTPPQLTRHQDVILSL